MNTKAKGSRQELKSKKILEAAGYCVTKAGASLGMWDLVGISSTDVVLVQVKTRDWPYGGEMEDMENFKCPANCRKLIHRWIDGKGQPDTKEI